MNDVVQLVRGNGIKVVEPLDCDTCASHLKVNASSKLCCP